MLLKVKLPAGESGPLHTSGWLLQGGCVRGRAVGKADSLGRSGLRFLHALVHSFSLCGVCRAVHSHPAALTESSPELAGGGPVLTYS